MSGERTAEDAWKIPGACERGAAMAAGADGHSAFLTRTLGLARTPGEERSLKGAPVVMDELKQLIAKS